MCGRAKRGCGGGVAGVPAADSEAVVQKLLKKPLAAKQARSTTSNVLSGHRGAVAQLVAEIVVSKDRLVVRLKSENADEPSDSPDDRSLTSPWQKPPSKRSRQILLPHDTSRSKVRPEQVDRRARLCIA